MIFRISFDIFDILLIFLVFSSNEIHFHLNHCLKPKNSGNLLYTNLLHFPPLDRAAHIVFPCAVR